MIDFPAAWAIARSVEPEYHHNACSFNLTNGGILCDCRVLMDRVDEESATREAKP